MRHHVLREDPHDVAHTPVSKPEPEPRYRQIIQALTRAAACAYCRRPGKAVMECTTGLNQGWIGEARPRCGGWCCPACHVFNRQEYVEFAVGIADGTIGVDEDKQPLAIRLFRGTVRQWKALNEHLRRQAKKRGVLKHGWVRIQRKYGGDVEVLVFGGPTSSRLPAPISRLEAADTFAVAVVEVERVDQDAMRGTKFYPITDSDKPKILIKKPKEKQYARVRHHDRSFVHGVLDNSEGAFAAERCAAYEPQFVPDDEPAQQRVKFGYGGYFGDRDRFLCAIEGFLDPNAPDFLICPVPMTYPPPRAVPETEPEPHGPKPFSDFDEEFERVKPNPPLVIPNRVVPVELREFDPILPLDAVAGLVGPRLAGIAKWLLLRVGAQSPPPLADETRRRLTFFVRASELNLPGEMRAQVAGAIECDIAAMRLALRPPSREAG